ncbi:MAG: hypothetical protein GY861_10465 [bacterium]|nr:hypothetical protein [bacterium]
MSLTYIGATNDNIIRDPDVSGNNITVTIPNFTNTAYNLQAYNYGTLFDDATATNYVKATSASLVNGYGKIYFNS